MACELTTPGLFSWNELLTTDVAGAKAFYAGLFGWTMEDKPMAAGMTYTVAKRGEQYVGGIMAMPPGLGAMPPAWGCYVTVADVDASAKKVVELGGQVYKEPTDIPGVGRFCVVADPQGAFFALITYVVPDGGA